MDGKTSAPRAHEFACAHGDFHVDGMDNMAEGRDDTVEPLIQRRRVAGILIAALISTMEAAERKSGSSWVSIQGRKLSVRRWPGARLLNRAVSISQLVTDTSRV